MLVLTRQVNQKIFLNDNIHIVVVEIGRHKVRLGIHAPSSIPIARDEIKDAVFRTKAKTPPKAFSGGLLVLSRTKGQSLWIGPEIKVTIADIRGNQVRIGFNAPQFINIQREENYDSMH